MGILNGYYTDQLTAFQQKKLSADTTLKVGEYKSNDKTDANQSAALMKVIEMIYNLEEYYENIKRLRIYKFTGSQVYKLSRPVNW